MPGSLPSPSLPRRVADLRAEWLRPALVACGLVGADEPVAIEAERIGADRGFTGAIGRVRWRSLRRPAAHGTLIAKLPDAAANFERCVREVHFFRELAGSCGLRVPRCLLAEADEASARVALLLEDVPGVDGDAAAGCTIDQAATVVTAMAAMHARWWCRPELGDARPAWLPRWGSGTAGAPRPHRRRAERFTARRRPFLERFGAGAPPALGPLLDDLDDRFEPLLERVAALPPTLIHADLHLDNVIFAPPGSGPAATIIDWQSVSAGPGAYDLALFLLGSLRGAGAHLAIVDLLGLYLTRLDLERPDGAIDTGMVRDSFADLALCVLAGFVSGYGGRDPESLVPRELDFVLGGLSADGLAGAVLHILRRT
ncbi:MAG: aminoglycoside phosphotransferase family protein [Planctomycetota bacterium]|jgi:hypothetical protein